MNYATEDLKERVKALTDGAGADVVYDPVGGPHTEAALRATAWNGRVLVIGFTAGDIPRVPTNLVLLKGCSLVGVFWGMALMRDRARLTGQLREVLGWVKDGSLQPHVHASSRSSRALDALREVEQRRVQGKVVVVDGGSMRRLRRRLRCSSLAACSAPAARTASAQRPRAAPAPAPAPGVLRPPAPAGRASAAPPAAGDKLFADALRAYHAALLVAPPRRSRTCARRTSRRASPRASSSWPRAASTRPIARLAELVEHPQFDLYADSDDGRAAVFRLGDALATAGIYAPARGYLRRSIEAKGAWDGGGDLGAPRRPPHGRRRARERGVRADRAGPGRRAGERARRRCAARSPT